MHAQRAEATCQGLRGDAVDAAVANAFLEAMQPAQLEVSLATLDQLEDQARQVDQLWQLRLERAHYEAELARRRFCVVEPENRLVARNLERDWNEKLTAIERREREYAALPEGVPTHLDPDERQRILELAQNLPAVWQAPTTTAAQRKQLLRFLIKDLTLTPQASVIHIGIRWQTEALTPLDIARPKRSSEIRRTAPAVIERVRALALEHTDRKMAHLLNEEHLTPGSGGLFTESKVKWIRFTYKISLGCPQGPAACPTGQRGDGRYSARAAAQLLNVNVSTIADWCQAGLLDSVQEKPHGPRWITLTPQVMAQLRKPWPQHKQRSPRPAPVQPTGNPLER